jgi:hypothetical protein
VTTFINLTITMTDSKGDGWNGNVLAIRQNNTVVGLFGSLFTSGSSSGPINIRVNARFETHIVVFRKGSMTD